MSTVLDIISDPVCPWCYIGKAKLDKALETRGEHPFDIHWRPFQLNPDMPAEGADRRSYLEGKFGGKENADRIYGQIEQAALAAGLDVDLGKIERTPNTVDAHRLIRWSHVEGRQTEVVDQLFHRYFKLGQDISDRDVLVDIATTVSMDAVVIGRLLVGDVDREEVIAEDARYREMGVSGVPTFIVGGKHAVVGAQEAEMWIRVIEDLDSLVNDT